MTTRTADAEQHTETLPLKGTYRDDILGATQSPSEDKTSKIDDVFCNLELRIHSSGLLTPTAITTGTTLPYS
ncbi:hypothetical protein J6590_082661 [Homalodisca vitripennis]|nr:hypothetical protein J6590_082661 [Homalodisca vitripennis]